MSEKKGTGISMTTRRFRHRCFAAAALAAFCGASFAWAGTQPRNKIARVVTLNQAGLPNTMPDRLEETMVRLDRAASFHPDIVCLPEGFAGRVVETLPGPITRRLAEWARQHSSYLIFGIRTRSGSRTYNTAVLLDRKGEVAGQYHKIHPTEGELRGGISPGEPDPPVFETDFGTIGIQICFDVNWWNTWKKLKRKGAKIVFFAAAYPADHQLRMLALMNEFYIVSSSRDRHSRIYDITGRVLAKTGAYQQWAGAALPVEKRLFEIDFHTGKVREIQKKYGGRVEVVWYHEDDWFTLASLDPDLTLADLIQEYGLTPLAAYRRRATKAIEKARSDTR